MRPSSGRLPRSSSARSLSSSCAQQGRAPSKPSELLRALPPFSRPEDALAAPSPASILDSPHKQMHRAAAPAADHAALQLSAGGMHSDREALLGASQALARLLDTTAAAIAAASSHVPSFVQGVLARLFPAASSISAAMPSPDGQALAVTTLLHPAAAAPGAPAAAAVHHSEPLGPAGVCSFHLAEAPSGESLRLMRAFLHQLDRRLEAQQAQQLEWPPKMPAPSLRPAYACAALQLEGCTSLESSDSECMPADCFWESL